MTPTLAPRILDLPPAVREALAAVPGPGWEVTRGAFLGGGYGTTETRPLARCGADVSDRYAWWPANPAAAVAAICVLPGGLALQVAHELLAVRMGDTAEDDHEAALGLIEECLEGSCEF